MTNMDSTPIDFSLKKVEVDLSIYTRSFSVDKLLNGKEYILKKRFGCVPTTVHIIRQNGIVDAILWLTMKCTEDLSSVVDERMLLHYLKHFLWLSDSIIWAFIETFVRGCKNVIISFRRATCFHFRKPTLRFRLSSFITWVKRGWRHARVHFERARAVTSKTCNYGNKKKKV